MHAQLRSWLVVIATGLATPAFGAQIWTTDCNFGFQSSYAQDEAVCVSGDFDYLDPGLFEFLPDCDVYVTSN